jgi:7,8-dihydropterin-6-yl-methyl-4-(beta-D-ribofuranosyl)aminobenzene 5'-phosphate synthase
MEPITLRSRPLDELVLTVVVDNETDTLSSVGADIPQHTEMIGHLGRSTPTTASSGHACFEVFDHLCVACHGFSVLLQGRVGSEVRTALFDAGPYGDVWLDNASRLDIDLAAIEVVFLSHWHWDHSGALPTALRAIADARSTAGHPEPLIVDLHPDRPDQRGVEAVPGTLVLLPPEPSFSDFTDAGAQVVTSRNAHLLCDGFFLGSGAIERVTAYETGLVGHHSITDGAVVADPLIMDERFLAAEVVGRGVTVLSACSHAGVVNACLGVRSHYPDQSIDVVLGGYHLAGSAMEARIDDTVRDLAELVRPAVVAPGHCTGWRAKAALAERFGPDRYGPSVVGTQYRLTTPADEIAS